MSKVKILMTLLFAIVCQMALAQSKVISGTVEDAMGPVMMANVVEQDANKRIVNAVQTDMMGNFSMEIKNPKNKLVVSYVGSKTFTTVIGDQTTFAIKLEDEKTMLGEITVKGRRSNSGGLNIDEKNIAAASQKFNLSEVEGMAFTSADEALQGEIAGLDIIANSGNLGAGTSMKLRGASGEPLIVVDDKPFEINYDDLDLDNLDNEQFSSLLAINVDDIESITVDKDAAATAIWGAKGADGVIRITTKRGRRQKPRLTVNYKFTGRYLPSGYDMLNGDNYTMMLKEAIYNGNPTTEATRNIAEINYDKSWGEYWNFNNNTDWVKEVSQFGQAHEANINLNGGGSKASFRISAGFKHETGTIIKQVFDQLTTTLALDYNVSDRIKFSTTFGLTYTDNNKNYTAGSSKNGNSNNNILAMAYAMAPNVSVYRRDRDGNLLGDYYLMNRVVTGMTPYDGPYSSEHLGSVVNIGNPVAYANHAWQREKVYSIRPDFNLKYEILGTGTDQHRLTLNARVYFDVYSNSWTAFRPATLNTSDWMATYNNQSANKENNSFKMGGRLEFVFTPHFKNEDFNLSMLARYEFSTTKYNYQYVEQNNLPTGLQSSTINGYLLDNLSNQPGTIKAADHYFLYHGNFSYKDRYTLDFSLRADGSSKYGPKSPWFISPGVSLRYNVSEEKFFEPLKKVVNMFGITGSWGITGSSRAKVDNFFNQYSIGGNYVYDTTLREGTAVYTMSGIMLDNLRPEKKMGLNLGFRVGLFNDLVNIDLDLYRNLTTDKIMSNVDIPTSAAWNGGARLAYANLGEMENKGWELVIRGNKFVKAGKFSMSASFNIGQDNNKLLKMDERVLENMNDIPVYNDANSKVYKKVEIGKPLNSIYGYNYKGVYQYSYEYLKNYDLSKKQELGDAWTVASYESWINEQLAAGKTFPVVVGKDGKVVMNGLQPQRMAYWAGDTEFYFNGGDAMYEDTNHDGNINELDIVYLGNSRPIFQGGFSLTLQYSNWKLTARFNYRNGVDLVNTARMALEAMSSTENQCSSVTYRWRKEGDGADGATVLPRALYPYGSNQNYNSRMSSRYVEDGSFLRLNNLQISYTFPKKQIKKWGLNNLTASITANKLLTFTKYSGLDPEPITCGEYTAAIDGNGTPVPRSFTANLTVGF